MIRRTWSRLRAVADASSGWCAATKLALAQRLAAQARRELARMPPAAPFVLDRRSAGMQEVLRRAVPRLAGARGVLGYGLGRRWRGGVETDEPCVQVFVREKLTPAALAERNIPALPRALGRAVPVDVVELGEFHYLAHVGSSLGVEHGRTKGTLGALAVDQASGDTVALTAMHVVGGHAPSGAPVYMPSPRDREPCELLGDVLAGTMDGTDIAKIRLAHPESAVSVMPGVGSVRGSRPLTYPGDLHTSIRMYGASSGRQHGRIINPGTTLLEPRLELAILAEIPTSEGDSGAAIVDDDRVLLGFLVGRYSGARGSFAVFTPATWALRAVQCVVVAPPY